MHNYKLTLRREISQSEVADYFPLCHIKLLAAMDMCENISKKPIPVQSMTIHVTYI